jgi:hypothetical protein
MLRKDGRKEGRTNAAAATLETKKKWKVNFILTLNFGTLSSSFDTVV